MAFTDLKEFYCNGCIWLDTATANCGPKLQYGTYTILDDYSEGMPP